MMWVVKKVSYSLLYNILERGMFLPAPVLMGINMRPIANLLGQSVNIDNCDTWFYTVFTQNATDETKEYWGKNTGALDEYDSDGIIQKDSNVLSDTCYDVNRTVPYWKDWEEDRIATYNGTYDSGIDGMQEFLM